MAASCAYYLRTIISKLFNMSHTKKAYLNEKYLRAFWRKQTNKKVWRMDHQQKNDQTECEKGLGAQHQRTHSQAICSKLQASVNDILPTTAAIIGHATGSRKLSAS